MAIVPVEKQSVFACTGEVIKTGVNFAGRTFTQVEGTDKLAKLVRPIIEFVTYFIGPTGPLGILSAQLKGLCDFFGSLNIISRIKDWTTGRASFINDAAKLASKIMLTIANFLETIKFFETLKLIQLGVVSSVKATLPFLNKVVDLSPIVLAKDLLVVGSATANLFNVPASLRAGDADKALSVIDGLKADKWKLKERVLAHVNSLQGAKRADARVALKDQNSDEFKEFTRLERAYQNTRKGVKLDDADIKARWDATIDGTDRVKLEKAQKRQIFWANSKAYHAATKTKGVLGLLNDIAKIVIIAAGIIGLTLLTLGAAPSFMIPFMTLSLVVGALGYTKFLYDDWYTQKKEAVSAFVAASGNNQAHYNRKYA